MVVAVEEERWWWWRAMGGSCEDVSCLIFFESNSLTLVKSVISNQAATVRLQLPAWHASLAVLGKSPTAETTER